MALWELHSNGPMGAPRSYTLMAPRSYTLMAPRSYTLMAPRSYTLMAPRSYTLMALWGQGTGALDQWVGTTTGGG